MIEVQYGSKGCAARAWKEIEEGRPVALRVLGWRRKLIKNLLSSYAEYDQLSRKGMVPRGLFLRLGLRTLFAPSIMGLCNHARSAGMAVALYERGEILEVRFEKPSMKTS